MPIKLPNDDNGEVRSEFIKDHETWNTCPECFKDWKDVIPVPGLLHRTRLCGACYKKLKNERT
jgi:hypothetical protein